MRTSARPCAPRHTRLKINRAPPASRTPGSRAALRGGLHRLQAARSPRERGRPEAAREEGPRPRRRGLLTSAALLPSPPNTLSSGRTLPLPPRVLPAPSRGAARTGSRRGGKDGAVTAGPEPSRPHRAPAGAPAPEQSWGFRNGRASPTTSLKRSH